MFYPFQKKDDAAFVVVIEAADHDTALTLAGNYGIWTTDGHPTQDDKAQWNDMTVGQGDPLPEISGVPIFVRIAQQYFPADQGAHGQAVFLDGTIQIY